MENIEQPLCSILKSRRWKSECMFKKGGQDKYIP